MVTSSSEQPRKKNVPPWCEDTLGDTLVVDGTPHYAIQDTSFDDGWIRSDVSLRTDKMR